jgi:Cu/Ag efflux protein CusF
MKHRLKTIAMAVCLLSAIGLAQPAKKSYAFRGKVEKVDEHAKLLTVANERIEGWMEAMTMSYEVDDAGVLKKVKPGDRIAATVYDGDYKLYQVKVVPPESTSKGGQ